MGKVSLLQQLYRQRFPCLDSCSMLETLVLAYLDDSPVDHTTWSHTSGTLLPSLKDVGQSVPLSAIEPRRRLLCVLLMLQDTGLLETKDELLASVRAELKAQLENLKQAVAWPAVQLVSIYQLLIELLLDGPPSTDAISPHAKISQLPSGAALLEPGGYWPWAQIPHPRFHAELGILWSIYSHLSGDKSYQLAAEQLAAWHRHTLDHTYAPFVGLFSQEEDVSENLLLINNALLFDATALANLAAKQREHLQKISALTTVDVPMYAVVLEKWMAKRGLISSSSTAPISLPSIDDPSLALIGKRLHNCSVVSTLVGGGTGMGCFHAGDVQIVSYGPQHTAILGDCRGFGIEGCQRLLKTYPQKTEVSTDNYVLEGTSRVVPLPRPVTSPILYRMGEHSGFWMESKQAFNVDKLAIDTHFYGLRDTSELAFAFFVKAKNCLVGAGRVVKPRSLDRYRGSVCSIELQSQNNTLSITPGCHAGEMQVIPLGGEAAFWGADFLIAYLFDSDTARYSWELTLKAKG